MDIYISVSDKDRRLTLDGDLDLLDRLLATIKAGRDERGLLPTDNAPAMTAQPAGAQHDNS